MTGSSPHSFDEPVRIAKTSDEKEKVPYKTFETAKVLLKHLKQIERVFRQLEIKKIDCYKNGKIHS